MSRAKGSIAQTVSFGGRDYRASLYTQAILDIIRERGPSTADDIINHVPDISTTDPRGVRVKLVNDMATWCRNDLLERVGPGRYSLTDKSIVQGASVKAQTPKALTSLIRAVGGLIHRNQYRVAMRADFANSPMVIFDRAISNDPAILNDFSFGERNATVRVHNLPISEIFGMGIAGIVSNYFFSSGMQSLRLPADTPHGRELSIQLGYEQKVFRHVGSMWAMHREVQDIDLLELVNDAALGPLIDASIGRYAGRSALFRVESDPIMQRVRFMVMLEGDPPKPGQDHDDPFDYTAHRGLEPDFYVALGVILRQPAVALKNGWISPRPAAEEVLVSDIDRRLAQAIFSQRNYASNVEEIREQIDAWVEPPLEYKHPKTRAKRGSKKEKDATATAPTKRFGNAIPTARGGVISPTPSKPRVRNKR